MRAAAWSVVAVALTLVTGGIAGADPKPKPVDIKAIRDQLQVFQDPEGGIYVVLPGRDGRVFYGADPGTKTRKLYEQIVLGRSTDGSQGLWDVSVWAPHIGAIKPASVGRRQDGRVTRYCTDAHTELTPVPGDKAKAVLDKSTFLTSAVIRRPHLLARDDSGTYYYVDVLRDQYGGKGYRVFVGKKGAMKQRALTDIATDSVGDVFGTKTGDLRLVRTDSGAAGPTVQWVKGEKRVTLYNLDPDMNPELIFKQLGIYGFTGTICEGL